MVEQQPMFQRYLSIAIFFLSTVGDFIVTSKVGESCYFGEMNPSDYFLYNGIRYFKLSDTLGTTIDGEPIDIIFEDYDVVVPFETDDYR